MTEAEWLAGHSARAMLQIFWTGRSDARKLRLFAVACARLYWDKLSGPSRRWVELAEEVAEKGLHEGHVLDERRKAHARAERSGKITTALASDVLAANPCIAALDAEYTLRRARVAPLLPRLVLDVFGNPFRPVWAERAWLGWGRGTVPALARSIYDERAFDRMPVLADALEDAGCANSEVLAHCRGEGPHVRGCWVVDLLLGRGESRRDG
jgi:hypothetical protein